MSDNHGHQAREHEDNAPPLTTLPANAKKFAAYRQEELQDLLDDEGCMAMTDLVNFAGVCVRGVCALLVDTGNPQANAQISGAVATLTEAAKVLAHASPERYKRVPVGYWLGSHEMPPPEDE